MNIEDENIVIVVDIEGNGSDSAAYKCDCGKQYSDRSGLRKHKLKCRKLTVIDKLDEKDEEIAALKLLVAQYDARLKKLGIKHAALIETHAEEIRQLTQKVQLGSQVLPQEPIVKKLKPEDFLIERCANAINCADFINTFAVERDDFTHDKFIDGPRWLFNVIERNLKGIGPTERPFHVIINSNTHKVSLYVKKDNEWVQCDDEAVQNFMRSFLRPILKVLVLIQDEEKRNILKYAIANYIPEKDQDGELIEKDWKKHRLNSQLLDDLDEYHRIILSNSSMFKDFLKLMKDKFTIS